MRTKLGAFALIAAMSCGVACAQNNPFAGQQPVKAELKKAFGSRSEANAEITATTTTDVMIGDTKLPKGSLLLGHVVEASKHTKESPDGTVTILFDHAKPKKGDTIAIAASLYKIFPAEDSMQRADAPGMRGGSENAAAAAMRPGTDANDKVVNGMMSKSDAPVQVASYIPGVAIAAIASPTRSGVLTSKNNDIYMLAGMNVVLGVAPAPAAK